jgi:hypothetical protein
MKTNFLKIGTIIALSMLSVNINAQKTSKYKRKTGPELRYGITAGATYSFQSGYKNEDGVNGIVGLTAGAFANYSFSDKLKLQLAAMYSEYGTNFEYAGYSTDEERQSYISIPLVLKGYVTDGIYFSVGPQVNMLLSSKFNSTDLKEYTKKADFGLTGGLGVHITPNLGLDANYYYGLGNIYTDNLGISDKIIYNAFTARLFYEF